MNPERMLRDFEKFSQQLQNYFQSLEDRFAWLVRTPLMVEIFIFAMLFFVFLFYVLGEKRKHLLIFLLILACPPTVFIPGLGKLVRESVWLSLKDNADQNNLWGWLYGLTPEGKGWSRKQVVYASVLITILAIMCVQVVKLAIEVEVDGGNAVPTQVAQISETTTSTATADITSTPASSSTAIPTNTSVAISVPTSTSASAITSHDVIGGIAFDSTCNTYPITSLVKFYLEPGQAVLKKGGFFTSIWNSVGQGISSGYSFIVNDTSSKMFLITLFPRSGNTAVDYSKTAILCVGEWTDNIKSVVEEVGLSSKVFYLSML